MENESLRPAEGGPSRRKTSGRGEKSRRRANNHTFTCRNMADIRADGETSQLWVGGGGAQCMRQRRRK